MLARGALIYECCAVLCVWRGSGVTPAAQVPTVTMQQSHLVPVWVLFVCSMAVPNCGPQKQPTRQTFTTGNAIIIILLHLTAPCALPSSFAPDCFLPFAQQNDNAAVALSTVKVTPQQKTCGAVGSPRHSSSSRDVCKCTPPCRHLAQFCPCCRLLAATGVSTTAATIPAELWDAAAGIPAPAAAV